MSIGDTTTVATGILRIDATAVDAGVNQAGNALDRLTTITRNSYFGLRNIALGFEALGAAALGTVAAGVSAATSWESGIKKIEVSALGSEQAVNANASAVSRLNSQFQAIAENTPVPIKAIESVGDTVARLGLTMDQTAPATKTIIDLNQTTGASYDTLANGIGKSAISLGLGAKGIQDFGNVLFELQRTTPATTEDILTLTQRILGMGSASHFSTTELLGLAAGVASTGGNVRTNVSSIQKFSEIIQTAITTQGANLGELARIAGETSDQSTSAAQKFSQAWAKDPGEALVQVLAGLKNLNEEQGKGQAILQGLGISNAQQIDSLLKVAQASDLVQFSLDKANQAQKDGNALQGAAKLAYGTTAAALEEAKNEIQLAAIGLSSFLLPAIVGVSNFVRNLAAGFLSLPGPVREVAAVTLLLVGGLAALAGGFLLLLPRFVLARDTLIQLAGGTTAQAAAQTRLVASNTGVAGSTETLIELTRVLIATQLVLIGEAEDWITALEMITPLEEGAAAGAVEMAAAEDATAASTSVLAAAMGALDVLLGPIGIGMAALGIFVAGVTALIAHLGQEHRNTAAATLDHASADQTLLSALKGTTDEITAQTNAWIVNRLVMDGTLSKLQQMGVDTKEVIGVIKGTIDNAGIKDVVTKIQLNAPSLSEAQDLIGKLQTLQGTYTTTVTAQNSLNRAQQDGVATTDQLGNAVDSLNGKELTNQQIADKEAQAAQGYAQAVLSKAQAVLSVKDAEEKLAQAEDDVKNKAELTRLAEEKVTEAQLNHQIAIDKEKDAEQALSTARSDQARKLAEEEAKLVTDRLAHQRAINSVADAQAKLNDLMKPENSALQLKEATDALTRSQLDLVGAQTAVSDAQWYLNYLQGEGASARDIFDAQQLLANANQDVADKTDKVADNQKKLSDLQGSGGTIARQQADAQLALAEAQQSVLSTEDQLTNQEEAIQKLRTDVANDTAYHQALLDVQTAQSNVLQTDLDVTTAQRNLHNIQDGSIERAFQRAQLDLEGALISQAQATVDVNQKQDEMQGKFWTSRDSVNALSTELTNLSKNYNGPIKTDLANMGTAVGNVGTSMGKLRDNTKQTNDETVKLGPNIAGAAKVIGDATKATPSGPTFFGMLWGDLKGLVTFFDQHSGTISKINDFLNPLTAPAAIGKSLVDFVTGHASGGLFTVPHLAAIAEDGPELILPLTDLARTQDLLQQSGILSQIAATSAAPLISTSSGSSSTTIDQSKTVHQGAFAPTIVVQKDPDDIIDDYFWRNRVLARSA